MDQLKGKKIAIVGLSVEGISSVEYLSRFNLDLTVCDQRDETKLDPGMISKLRDKQIKTLFGKQYLDKLSSYNLIIRTPGFPLWNEKLEVAVRKGAKVTSQIQLFFELCKGKIIGVTGTKGKGTTSSLIYAILKDNDQDVFLGGNIGTPPFSFLDKIKKKFLGCS